MPDTHAVNVVQLIPTHSCGARGRPYRVYITERFEVMIGATCPVCNGEDFTSTISIADAVTQFETAAA